MFKSVNPKQSFPEMEKEILKFWKENKIFEKSVENRPKENSYVFYDGPPFATGLPHYGHILAGTMKDTVPRYWTMRGRRVERRFGWDCHGLPVENLVESELGVKGKKEIEEKIGIKAFNEACEKSVLKYTSEWESTVERMGRWVDFKNDYKTMDLNYMESIWWVFKEIWDKNLIYQGHKPMHICPSCVTPLSNFEVSLGYSDVTDLSATVKFRLTQNLENKIQSKFKQKDTPAYALAWTTTPWTLPGNIALAFGAKIKYIAVLSQKEQSQEIYILAADRLESVFGDEQVQILGEISVAEYLISQNSEPDYSPLFNYYEKSDEEGRKFKIVIGDFITTLEGTGIVHIAPMFGEDDFNLSEKENLAKIQHVNMDGTFKEEISDFAGKQARSKDRDICKFLEEKNLLLKSENYRHSYPHCWRCDTALLNYATSSWFLNVEKIKEKMLQANEQIHWVPSHLKYGRFGKWLENAKDWCISRNRFWGAPLPIWVAEDQSDFICVGSIEELKALSGVEVKDLHKQFVDEITFEKNGKKYTRTPEVLDCWFESGAMPYAQNHYPFENKDWFEQNFPAEFIAEGLDQTRGWFYTLVVLSTALFDKTPFKNVIVNGLVLAEDGKKMSKRLKNYPDPNEIFEKYGADALRFYMMNSPVVKAEILRFSEKGVADVVRNILLPLWNSYGFFVTYANIDKWQADESLKAGNLPQLSNRLDTWIVSELEQLLLELTRELDNYDLQQATTPIAGFINSLTNWYIRRSRRRFWKSENDSDKNSAYSTLYYVLKKISLILAPFTPFIAEEIYKNLSQEQSVHLADWPKFNESLIDTVLNDEIETIQTVVSLGLSIRAQHKIKVRQVLSSIEVVGLNSSENPQECSIEKRHCLSSEDIEMIKEELNIKEIIFKKDSAEIAEKIAKPIGSKIGAKYGKEVQEIIQQAKSGNFTENADHQIIVANKWTLSRDEYEMSYLGKEGHFVAADCGIVVSLNTQITPELKEEGIAREIIRQIQNMRKEADYKVDDRIKVAITGDESLQNILEKFGDTIKAETLSTEIANQLEHFDQESILTIDEFQANIQVTKAS
jgi:isoleucyl-tRNA synthetase